MNTKSAKLQFIFTMLLFGTIGTLSRFIDMPSSVICLVRAILGVLTIMIILAIRRNKLDLPAIKRNLGWLTLSSSLMCINWVCQFEAFKYTTIATATLCYYMQPIFFIILAVIILKESISIGKILCVIVAFVGMILVSGVLETGLVLSELKGVLFGIAGGLFYALVVIINKYIKDISAVDTTVVQLAIASVIMLPYTAITGGFAATNLTSLGIICLLVLGILHTGISYVLYFDAVNKLPAQTAGILSYIDPVEAVLLSALLLREPISLMTIAGAVLILGSTAVSEKIK